MKHALPHPTLLRGSLALLALFLVSALAPAATQTAPACAMNDVGPGVPHNPNLELAQPIVVPVFFHVLRKTDGTGDIPLATLEEQIDVLNDAFATYGGGSAGGGSATATFTFELIGVDRVTNDAWFENMRFANPVDPHPNTGVGGADDEVKQTLAVDPLHVLNVYTADAGGTSYAYYPFPFEYPQIVPDTLSEDSFWHGVVLHYEFIPGGPPPRDEGEILAHEVGHYLGLYHPYFGGCLGGTPQTCSSAGDMVCDTRQHRFPLGGCPVGTGTNCTGIPGPAPIENHMEITSDACRTEFTPGQGARMSALTAQYRPNLGMALPALNSTPSEVDERRLIAGSSFDVTASAYVESGATLVLEPGVTLSFAPGSGLHVLGSLDAEEALLTEATSGLGWNGLDFQTGATGTLTDVTVEHYGNPSPGLAPFYAGVSVYSADVTLTGTEVRNGTNAYGVAVFGTTGVLEVSESPTRASRIFFNENGGAYADAGGRLLLDTNSEVSLNAGNGVTVRGKGSTAYLYEALIAENDGVGLQVSYDATVILDRLSGGNEQAITTIHNNEGGGLFTDQGGALFGGYYKDPPGVCSQNWKNRVTEHFYLGSSPFDARAKNGSTLYAECDFWGEGIADPNNPVELELDADPSSLLDATPVLLTPPSLRDGDASVALRLVGHPDGGARGEGTRALVAEAIRAEAHGEWTAAFAHTLAALNAATDADTRRLAFSAATRLLGRPATPPPPPALLVALAAHASAPGPMRPWALRTLMAAYGTQGDVPRARATAATLVADYGGSDHALSGLASEVALSLRADDADGARAALATLEATWPETEPTQAARWLVAVALGTETMPAPSLRGRGTTQAGETDETAPGGFRLQPAYPNPFGVTTVVPFTLAGVAVVRIAVLDVLGREVAVLAEGRFPAGRHEAVLDGAMLPSGTYLIRAEVTPGFGAAGSGASRTFTQPVTLLK